LNNDNRKLIAERAELKAKLDLLYAQQTYAAFIRSKAKWFEYGEKNTSYFLTLEKIHKQNNVIDLLKDDQGEMYDNDPSILKHCESFYSKLYSSNKPTTVDITTYLNNTYMPNTLNKEVSGTCEGLITINECDIALKQFKSNKSPGSDGLTVEFYKKFWKNISKLLVESFNEAFADKTLSESRNTAIISLIFKKGEKHNIKNYRPISLTNVDYKILAFVLANRLQNVISKIISEDQTGYIRGRFIGNNLRKLLDIDFYLKEKLKTGVLLLLDFEKAFDCVEWSFLESTLRKFGFDNVLSLDQINLYRSYCYY
jgi:hypothetical protein